MFGSENECRAALVVMMFIRLTNTAIAPRSTLRRCYPGRRRCNMTQISSLPRLRVEKLEDLAGAFGADARNLAEVGDRGALDFLQRSKVMQQRAFARRPDAGDFLQASLADVLFA